MVRPPTGVGRGIAAAALVAAAAWLAVTAGHHGVGDPATAVVTVLFGLAAIGVLAGWVPLVAAERWFGVVATGLLIVLAAATALLTVADQQVRHGRWIDVTIQAAQCVPVEHGDCVDRYRVADAVTEHDHGWIGCDGAGYRPGERTRIRADPAGRWPPSLAPCALTSTGWSAALRWALAAHGAVALIVLVVPIVRARRHRRRGW